MFGSEPPNSNLDPLILSSFLIRLFDSAILSDLKSILYKCTIKWSTLVLPKIDTWVNHFFQKIFANFKWRNSDSSITLSKNSFSIEYRFKRLFSLYIWKSVPTHTYRVQTEAMKIPLSTHLPKIWKNENGKLLHYQNILNFIGFILKNRNMQKLWSGQDEVPD